MGKRKFSHKINVELSEDSISKAYYEVLAYKKEVDEKVDEVCRRIAEIGAKVARQYFNSNPDGTVSVSVEPMDGGYMLCADGKDVAFLEFGAGDYTSTTHPFADEVSFEVRPGSWSEEGAGIYSLRGFWHYNGQYYEGIVPTYAMANASAEMIHEMIKVAKEVFK